MMGALAVTYTGGVPPLWHELVSARAALFWLLLGGFVWVVGDLFQQYAVKYAGISRGIPLSNTNQLWGLLWGILVFAELQGAGETVYAQVIGGSLLVALGAGAIALSSATAREQERWREAAGREHERYRIEPAHAAARGARTELNASRYSRRWIDWSIVAVATATFVGLAAVALPPRMALHWGWMAGLALAMLALLASCGLALWRTTRFL
jgi:hypothetical protein